MKVKWLLQDKVFGNDLNSLISSLNRFEHKYTVINSFDGRYPYKHYDENDCVICYGSTVFIRQIQNTKWIPGSWCNFDNFKCSTYYAYYGKYLLNYDYKFLPLGEFKRRICPNGFFIRPDSGIKLFNGHVPKDERDFEYSTAMCSPDTMIVFAPERNGIEKEWRIIVSRGKIIAGCQYMENMEHDEQEGYPKELEEFVLQIASEKWQPDDIYTIDIGLYRGEYRLIEINSFSCSGFYCCDTDKIVKYIGKLARKEYRDYNV